MSIAAGKYHSLAAHENGEVYAWGDNERGQAGDKTRMALYAPTRIKDEKNERLSGVKKVWAGHDHGMARTDEKTLIWGRNNDNQLGDKTGKDRPVPGPVRGGDGGEVTPLDIAVGKSHAVSVLEDSTVFAWGRGVVGGLGMETFGAESDFVQVQSCFALRKDGSVWAWGYNKEGQVGDNGAPNHRPVPVPVHGVDDVGELKDVRWISGYSSRYAVLNDGRVCVWGWNGNNETGTNTRTTSRRHIPYPIYLRKDDQHVFEEKVAKVKAGPLTSYAITEDGALWGWGHIDGKHVLGLGYNVTDFYPKKVMEKGVADVAARDRGGLAVKDDGSLWIWGHNSYGLLGQGHFNATTFDTPKQMNGLPSMIAAAAGAYYTLALDGEGFVWAWGDNRYGQLGINSTADKQATPAKVAMDASGNPLENVVAISATGNNGMALTSDGFVWTWGQNQYGCLGYAAAGNANQRTARRVEMSSEESRFLFGVQGIACGGAVSFALGDDGIVRAWGYGKEGQRGDGTKTETKTYPVETLLPKTKDQANKENPT
ncbi:hypothetical protein EPICR_140001 [Candidatus Desulfarcum epimagneticum]|uniref:RCC1-like domain-containing protein n=1 Tax=uncultured Desulfobacteraceae bacterium TaxID=218296 RepID=A0A484HFM1_9BACT|nr:hypothetical protein EPICR_140001 [uncultured Desulfobacteraceae bacterium]